MSKNNLPLHGFNMQNLQQKGNTQERINTKNKIKEAIIENNQLVDLKNQQITHISCGDFEEVTTQTDIHLSRNPITNIESGAFPIGIKKITITKTSLKEFGANVAPEGLTHLYLNDNPDLDFIDPNAFPESLEFLDVSNTKLGKGKQSAKEIINIIQKLKNVKVRWSKELLETANKEEIRKKKIQESIIKNNPLVDLKNKKITHISCGDFEKVTKQKYIHLSQNPITAIESGAFPIGIKKITITKTSLKEFGANVAPEGLTHLYLNDNPDLDFIDPNAFPKSLEFLDVSNTKLGKGSKKAVEEAKNILWKLEINGIKVIWPKELLEMVNKELLLQLNLITIEIRKGNLDKIRDNLTRLKNQNYDIASFLAEIERESFKDDLRNNLALVYKYGIKGIIEPNLQKTFKLFSECRENKISQYNLAKCYLNGEGVAKDYEQAFQLLSKSAEKRCSNAQYELALLYETGKAGVINKEEALKLLQKAANQGHKKAQTYLCEKELSNDPENLKLILKLAGIYESSKLEKAVELYEKAAAIDQNNVFVLGKLDAIYEKHGLHYAIQENNSEKPKFEQAILLDNFRKHFKDIDQLQENYPYKEISNLIRKLISKNVLERGIIKVQKDIDSFLNYVGDAKNANELTWINDLAAVERGCVNQPTYTFSDIMAKIRIREKTTLVDKINASDQFIASKIIFDYVTSHRDYRVTNGKEVTIVTLSNEQFNKIPIEKKVMYAELGNRYEVERYNILLKKICEFLTKEKSISEEWVAIPKRVVFESGVIGSSESYIDRNFDAVLKEVLKGIGEVNEKESDRFVLKQKTIVSERFFGEWLAFEGLVVNNSVENQVCKFIIESLYDKSWETIKDLTNVDDENVVINDDTKETASIKKLTTDWIEKILSDMNECTKALSSLKKDENLTTAAAQWIDKGLITIEKNTYKFKTPIEYAAYIQEFKSKNDNVNIIRDSILKAELNQTEIKSSVETNKETSKPNTSPTNTTATQTDQQSSQERI